MAMMLSLMTDLPTLSATPAATRLHNSSTITKVRCSSLTQIWYTEIRPWLGEPDPGRMYVMRVGVCVASLLDFSSALQTSRLAVAMGSVSHLVLLACLCLLAFCHGRLRFWGDDNLSIIVRNDIFSLTNLSK